jgi:hypothetical protein
VEFIETFPYIIRYKRGKENVVADALSSGYALLSTLDAKLLGFEHIKELYAEDHKFCVEYRACEKITTGKFFRLDGSYACIKCVGIGLLCACAQVGNRLV